MDDRLRACDVSEEACSDGTVGQPQVVPRSASRRSPWRWITRALCALLLMPWLSAHAQNNAPVFSPDTTTRTVAENAATGTNVGAVLPEATDADGDTLTYVLGGTDESKFSFDDSTRQLKTAEVFDYETTTSYEVTITADDGNSGNDVLTVTVNVDDVDEPPATPATPTVGTPTHHSVVVSWTAPSVGGGPAINDYDVQYREGTTGNFTDWPHTGTGTTTTLTNLTPSTAHQVQVRAKNDEGASGWSSSASFTTEANAAPEFDPDTATREVAENTASGTDIGDPLPAATDDDNDPLTYTLGGTDAASFSFDGSTRQLSTSAALDYETKDTYTVTVTADDTHGGTDVLTVTVSVTDVTTEAPGTPAAPTFGTTTHHSVVVNWTAPTNTGPDIDDYDVQYREGTSGAFTDWSFTGDGTTTTLTNLTPSTAHQVQVRAKNDEGASGWSSSASFTTEANAAPEFDPDTATREVAENTASGTDIGDPLPAATDDDNDPLTYTLGGTDAASFSFDGSTRQLSTSAALDYETKDTYTVTVTADDTHGGTDVLTVTVNVTDDNTEAPGTPAAPTFGTRTHVSVVVNWLAPSNPGPDITDYDVQYRTGTDSFADAGYNGTTTGTTLAGLTPSTTYDVQVRATNAEGTGAWSSSGSVTTKANTAPAFSPTTTTRSVAENTASGNDIGTALHAATDSDGDTLTYTLGGTDASSFSFDGSTRKLSTSAALDYETKETYTVTVTAADPHGGTADLTVTVNVTDVSEPPAAPDAPTFGTKTRYTVVVNWTAPSNTGPAIDDYDVQYREGSTGSFTAWSHDDDTTTTTLTGLDSDTAYEVQVRASNDEGTGDWSSSGSVTTDANKVPVFSPTSTTRSIAENTASDTDIGSALHAATDGDGDTLTYTLVGTDASSFDFDDSTRQLSTSDSLDYETKMSYSVTMRVDDGHGDTADLAVTVNVTDVNEPPEAPDAPTFGTKTRYTVVVNWTAPSNTGPAIDDYDVQYREGSTGSFTAWSHDDDTTTTTLTGLDSDTAYEVQVRASNDEGTGAWSSSGSVTTDANQVPVFSPASVSRNLDENTPPGTDIGAALPEATDGDGDTQTYTLGGTDAASFAFDATTRQLSTAAGASFDYETKTTYSVTMTADDGHGDSADLTVTVNVNDVNEPPEAPAEPTFDTVERYSLNVNWTAPSNTGPPIDDYDVHYRTGTGSFIDAGYDGTTLTTTLTGLQQTTTYEVRVRAANPEGIGAWSASGTVTTATNQAPVFSPATASRGVMDNSPPGTLVGAPLPAATDGEGDTLTYSLGGPDELSFAFDPATRQLTTAAGETFDFETKASYEVEMWVDDGHGGSATLAVTVVVGDIDEPPDRPAAPRLGDRTRTTLYMFWRAPTNTGPPITDYDVRYRAAEPGDEPFMDARHDGRKTGRTITGLKPGTSYEVQVRARNDEGVGAWSPSARARTVEENLAPYFESLDTYFVVEENTLVVGSVAVTDPDPEDDVTYALTDVDGDLFSVDSDAMLVFRSPPSYESPLGGYLDDSNTYRVTVVATGGSGERALEVSMAYQVRVTDAMEPPEAPAAASSGPAVRNSLTVRWEVPTNTGPPVISYHVRYRAAESGDDFIDAGYSSDTEITITGLEPDTVYEVQVRATNAEGIGPWSEITTRSTAPERALHVPLFESTGDARRHGFVRIINNSPAGTVEIVAIDEAGMHTDPVSLAIDAGQAVHFNSSDLENGNPAKGIEEGVGPSGLGDWRLQLDSELDVETLAYSRTADGFVTALHNAAPSANRVHRIAFFNPASNVRQLSRLRLVNATDEEADVSITGIDDAGADAGPVTFTIPAGTSVELTAADLESGTGLTGALGDGTGKWRLQVRSETPLVALSLLESPSGHLTNLSTVPGAARLAHRDHVVVAFPAAGGDRQGFVRVINRSENAGSVTIQPRDNSDREYAALTLALGPRAAAHFNSDDLEAGARDKGLTGSTGSGTPPWRLYFSSDLDIDVLAYQRMRQDGFLTSAHDRVPIVDGEHRVVFFNPGSNHRQVSRLALINEGTEDATVTVRGTDDHGESPGSPVVITVPPGATLMPTALELETGTGDGIDSGALGDGKGKWRLAVTADQPILVMSLLDSPTGHRTNLSTAGDETIRD